MILSLLFSLAFAENNYYQRYAELMTKNKMFVGDPARKGCPKGYTMKESPHRVDCISKDKIQLIFAIQDKKITEVMLKNPDNSLECVRYEELYSKLDRNNSHFKKLAIEFVCFDGKASIHWYDRKTRPTLSTIGTKQANVAQFVPIKELVKQVKNEQEFPINKMSPKEISKVLDRGPNKKMTIILSKKAALALTSDFEKLEQHSTLVPFFLRGDNEDKALGLLAQDVTKGSIIERINLKPGDVIMSLDGMKTDDKKYAKTLAPFLLVNLKTLTSFTMDILRGPDFLETTWEYED